MADVLHSQVALGSRHAPHNLEYPDTANRVAGTNEQTGIIVSANNLYQFARQQDDNTLWMLTGVGPITWLEIGTSFTSLWDRDVGNTTVYPLNVGDLIGGGIASGGDLTLTSTTHATKGNVYVGAAGAAATFDEVNNDLTLANGTNVNEFSVDGTMAGNSDDAVPTEKAVKTYVDGAALVDLDGAYNNFGSNQATVVVDNAEGQGDLKFDVTGPNWFAVDCTNCDDDYGFTVFGTSSTEFTLFERAPSSLYLYAVLQESDITCNNTFVVDCGNSTFKTAGSAKSITNILKITNEGNAVDMDGTGSALQFNQFYYDAGTPAIADAGRIAVVTETDWTSTVSTQDAYMSFQTALDGSVSEKMRLTSAGDLGIGVTPSYKFSIGSTDNSDQIWIYHDNTNAYLNWTDGNLIVSTSETDATGILDVRGNGAGFGRIYVRDEDNAEYLEFTCSNGVGYIRTVGSSPNLLFLQDNANAGINCFSSSSEGETQDFKIYGYYTGDALRALEIGLGDAADTASFDGVSNYLFDGALKINSTDSSDQISIYHDNSDAYFTTTDGSFVFITDEGTDTSSSLNIYGKGDGSGVIKAFNSTDTEYLNLFTSGTNGYISTAGVAPTNLIFQNTAHAGILCFNSAAEGETPEFKIYGYRTSDALRSLEIGCGVDFADCASFDGLGSYYFDGSICAGAGPLTNMVSGDILAEGGSLVLKEITTPTADANYGKIYSKADNKLYFQDGAGTEHCISCDGASYPQFQFFADQVAIPLNADWTVNNAATASPDSNNNGLDVLLFDDTTEEGIGLIFEIPTGATNIVFTLRSRAETSAASNLNVVPKLYVREAPDNAAVESWSAGTDMTTITMGTSNEYFQYDTQTIALSTLSLVAGRICQIELTRNTGSGSDTLVGDWALLLVGVSFT